MSLKRITKNAVFLSLVWMFVGAAIAWAEVRERTVTISQSGIALFREVDVLAVPPGRHTVVLEGFPQTMDLETLTVRPLTEGENLSTYTLVAHYRPISENQLLKNFVGKQVDLVMTNPKGSLDARMVRRVQVLSEGTEGGSPVFLTEDGVYTGEYHGIFFPSLPEVLTAEPKAFWDVENKNKAPVEVRAERLYEASGLQWKAFYVLYLNAEASQAALEGRVLLHNTTDVDFPGVKVLLLAGDLRQARRGVTPRAPMADMARAAKAAAPMEATPVFEYHLYRLPEPVTLGAGDPVQVTLVKAPSVPVERRLVSTGDGSGAEWGRERNESQKQPVRALFDIRNEVGAGLGMPLPAGQVSARLITENGEAIPLGEDTIEHTPVHGTLHLEFGRSFDVRVERALVEAKKVGQQVQRLRWVLTVFNGKAQPERIFLEDTLSGDWKIIQSSQPYEKVHAGLVRFPVEVPAQGRAEVSYEVEITSR
ncbi:MAG: DUF4139 domain-containing protein [Desulfosoma sp.]